MDFYGTFEHTIDGKGRLVMPSTFRSAFEGGGVAAMVEDYAALFTTDEWGRYRRKLEDSGRFTRDDLQWIFSLTSTFIPDAQNRISLPIKLRDHVGRVAAIGVAGRTLVSGADVHRVAACAQGQRANVAHEHASGVCVEPEKAQARTRHGAAEHHQFSRAGNVWEQQVA